MKGFWVLIIGASFLGVAIVIFWIYGNLDDYGWKLHFDFLFGSNHNWFLLLTGMPLAGVLGYMLRAYLEETVKTTDRENLALQIAILQNQEERVASMLKEQKEFDLYHKTLKEREAKVSEDEMYIAKAKGWERDLKATRETSRRYKEEIVGLKKCWKDPTNKVSI